MSTLAKRVEKFKTVKKTDQYRALSKLYNKTSWTISKHLKKDDLIKQDINGLYYLDGKKISNKWGEDKYGQIENFYNQLNWETFEKEKMMDTIASEASRFDNMMKENKEEGKRITKNSSQSNQSNFLEELSRDELIKLCSKIFPLYIKGVINE